MLFSFYIREKRNFQLQKNCRKYKFGKVNKPGNIFLQILVRDQKLLFFTAATVQQFFKSLLRTFFLLQDNAQKNAIRIGLLLFFRLFNRLIQFFPQPLLPILLTLATVVKVIIALVVACQACRSEVDEAELWAYRGVEARNSFLATAARPRMRGDSNLGQKAFHCKCFLMIYGSFS